MPVLKEKVQYAKEVVKGFKCDRCGAEYTVYSDIFEVNEVFHGTHECGYGSVFEDGATYEITLCQHCAKELLGEFMVKKEEHIYPWNDQVSPCEIRKAQ